MRSRWLAKMSRADDVLACVDELIGLEDPSQLPKALAGPLRKLIRYDFLVYNEINSETGAILTVSDPPGVESANASFETYAYQHPLLAYYQATRDPSVLRMSDHISLSGLHRLDLYNEFLRDFGIEHQIVCTIPAVRTVAIGLVLTRQRHDFSAADCELLAQLRQHVLRAYRAARRQAEVQLRSNSLQDAIAASGRAVVVADARGNMTAASANAEALLSAYGVERIESLNLRLRTGDSMTISLNGCRMTVTRAGSAFLLDEHIDALSPMRLRRFGLSGREAEVLRLVDEGASNQSIADRLRISVRTVKKHLERVYEKLGVDSRTAALACARRLTDPPAVRPA
jgi:DNA-binding CsgD family transcriptional regulator